MGLFTRIEGGKLKHVFPYYQNGKRTQPGFDTALQAVVEAETHDDRISRKQTLRAWMRHYIAYIAPPAETTYGRHIRTKLNLCIELVGEVKLHALDTNDIQRLYDALLKVERIESPDTAHDYINIVSTCLNDAIRQGRLERNPVTKWRSVPANKHPRTAHKPDLPDRRKTGKIADDLPTFALTGMGLIEEAEMTSLELTGLRIDDVDLEAKRVAITHCYNPNFNDIRPVLAGRVRDSHQLSEALVKLLSDAIALARSIGSKFVINVLKLNGRPYARTMIPRKLRKFLYAAQVKAKVKSRRTEVAHKTEDFRDRGVVTRLNGPRPNLIVIQARAGYACHFSFSKRFGSLIKSPDEHKEMARAQSVMATLSGLNIPRV